MRTSSKWTMSAFATACLMAGPALAQDTPLTGASADQDQANNERYWGIVNNSNNSFKTWPVTMSDPAFDRWALARQARRTASAPKAPPAPAATAAPATAAAPVAPATPQ